VAGADPDNELSPARRAGEDAGGSGDGDDSTGADRGARRVTRARLIERRLARSRRRFIVTTLVVALAIGGAVAWFGLMQGRHHGRLAGGVSVCGLDIGGLRPAEAQQRLDEWVARRNLLTVVLTMPGGAVELPLERLGITFDSAGTVAAAMRSGRLQLLGMGLWAGDGEPVDPVVRVRPDTYVEGLVVVRDRVDVAPEDATLRLLDGEVVVVPAKDGVAVDDIALERALLDALTRGRRYAGPVPTRVVTPEVTTADAEERRAAAATYLRRPLVLRLSERRVRLQPAVLATLLSLKHGVAAGDETITFDNDRTRQLVQRIFGEDERAPVPAEVAVKNGSAVITQSKEGVAIDLERLVADMDAVAAQGGLRAVHVQLKTVYPSPTTDELLEMGLAALGSEFTTYYSPRNEARAGNIARAAELVDGTIVRPGRVFSLNGTLGPRTQNRGFDAAPVIVDGVLLQGVGGGICQYATTLFNAAFFAGLPIVERHPHTFSIDHYPLGRDAAVSWGAADLRFRNDTDRPLMIRSYTGEGALTVVILGATDRSVSYSTGKPRNVRRPATTRAAPRTVEDADLAGGVVKWEKGADGYSITVVRTVRSGGRVLFRDRFFSTYAPKDWVKRVGARTR